MFSVCGKCRQISHQNKSERDRLMFRLEPHHQQSRKNVKFIFFVYSYWIQFMVILYFVILTNKFEKILNSNSTWKWFILWNSEFIQFDEFESVENFQFLSATWRDVKHLPFFRHSICSPYQKKIEQKFDFVFQFSGCEI